MRFKVLSMFAAVLLLAACETTPEDTSGGETVATTTPAPAPSAPAATPQLSLQEQLINEVGDRVFFDFDKYNLKPEGRETVEALAAWLNARQNVTLTIEGHADERGTREYNIALGARRATAVKTYLSQLGVNVSRVRTVSYGKERPVAVCNDISCWSQNRRAVTVLGHRAGS